jgi:hypothetical protein
MSEDRAQLGAGSRHDDAHPLIGGAAYRHPARRGRWRLEVVGRKWLTFRSLEVMGSHGRWLSFREARADWPNAWVRD